MPSVFKLYNKTDGKIADWHKVDAELCALFGEPVDPKHWVDGWMGSIGFSIATGSGQLGSQELRDYMHKWWTDPKMMPDKIEDREKYQCYQERLNKILAWLEEHYTSNSWHEMK